MTLTAPPADDTSAADDDTELIVARVAGGDHESLGALYDALSACAFGVITRALPSGPRAEAVLLDVFEEVWRTAGSRPPALHARDWILRIAARRTVAARRLTGQP